MRCGITDWSSYEKQVPPRTLKTVPKRPSAFPLTLRMNRPSCPSLDCQLLLHAVASGIALEGNRAGESMTRRWHRHRNIASASRKASGWMVLDQDLSYIIWGFPNSGRPPDHLLLPLFPLFPRAVDDRLTVASSRSGALCLCLCLPTLRLIVIRKESNVYRLTWHDKQGC